MTENQLEFYSVTDRDIVEKLFSVKWWLSDFWRVSELVVLFWVFSFGFFFCFFGLIFLWWVLKWLYILLKIGIARIKVWLLACAPHSVHFILERFDQVPPKWAVVTIWKWSYGRGWRRGTGCNEICWNMFT